MLEFIFVLNSFEGKPQNSRKSSANQKQAQKSTSERGTRQNTRGSRPEPAIQIKDTLHASGPIGVNDAQQISIVNTIKEEHSAKNSVVEAETEYIRKSDGENRDTDFKQGK